MAEGTPQHRAGELIADLLNDRFGFTMWSRDLDRFGEEIAQRLSEAGLLTLAEAGATATESGRETP